MSSADFTSSQISKRDWEILCERTVSECSVEGTPLAVWSSVLYEHIRRSCVLGLMSGEILGIVMRLVYQAGVDGIRFDSDEEIGLDWLENSGVYREWLEVLRDKINEKLS